ncbi:MAG: phosphoglycerate dehydrogenase, partial [Bacteroidia bacterium]|nr:phosphoglycerate dehydrogenase [Bacteroidia bacterium]
MKYSFPKEKIKFLLLENVHARAATALKEAGYADIDTEKRALPENELIERIRGVHVLGVRSKTRVTPAALDAGEKLLAIGAFCIGVDGIDLIEATRRGVAVFNAPYSGTRSVAELTIAAAVMLLRRVPEKNAAAHCGRWLKSSDGCREVRGKTIGVVGYGRIGSQVSVLAESMGMRVIFYDIEPKLALGNARACASLDELLAESDVVTLHVPDTPLTRNLMGERQIATMKPGAVLINYARGKAVDYQAAAQALKDGRLGGAAADVFPHEPASSDETFVSPLQNLNNVLLTPHIGGSTQEAQENIGLYVADKLVGFLDRGVSLGSVSIPELNLPHQSDVHRLLHIHRNTPGVLSEINRRLSDLGVNIVGQYL